MDTGRAHVLSRLAAEKRQALGCFEYERAAQIQSQIDGLSVGGTHNPAAEKAASPSRTPRKTTPVRRPARPPRKGI